MKRPFQLTVFDCALLVVNLMAFGACLVLMALKGASVPLVLLTAATGLGVAGTLGSARCRTARITSEVTKASGSSH